LSSEIVIKHFISNQITNQNLLIYPNRN